MSDHTRRRAGSLLATPHRDAKTNDDVKRLQKHAGGSSPDVPLSPQLTAPDHHPTILEHAVGALPQHVGAWTIILLGTALAISLARLTEHFAHTRSAVGTLLFAQFFVCGLVCLYNRFGPTWHLVTSSDRVVDHPWAAFFSTALLRVDRRRFVFAMPSSGWLGATVLIVSMGATGCVPSANASPVTEPTPTADEAHRYSLPNRFPDYRLYHTEESPALATDGRGRAYLAVLERLRGGPRIAVYAIRGSRRHLVDSIQLDEAVALGRPALTGRAVGVSLAFSAELREGGHRILHTVVDSDGASVIQRVETGGGVNILPRIATADGRTLLVWESNQKGQRSIESIWLDQNGGSSRRRTLSSPESNNSNPDVTGTRSGDLYVVWDSFRDGQYDLFGRRFHQEAWGPELRLTKDPRMERHPRLASFGEEIWVGWQAEAYEGGSVMRISDQRIFVARVDQSGRLHSTLAPFEPAAVEGIPLTRRPVFSRKPAKARAQPGGGLRRPDLAFDAEGRLWVSARQSASPSAGWLPILRSYEGGTWSRPDILLHEQGRWHAVPLAWDSEGGIAAVQSDDQPATVGAGVGLGPAWHSEVKLIRFDADGRPATRATTPLEMPPTDFTTRKRRTDSNALQAPISRRLAGRTLHLYWGNLHAHSSMSVCDRARNPPPEDLLAIERDLDGLDFCALTDHGYNLDQPLWQYTRETVAQYDDPGRFLTLLGQEWTSGGWRLPARKHRKGSPGKRRPFGHTRFGHHNIIFENPRYPTYYDAMDGPISPADVARDIHPEEFVMIPHALADFKAKGHANPPIDWTFHDEVHMPVAEICQQRGSYECLGCPQQAEDGADFRGSYLQDAWATGAVVGAIASPDHAGGRGYAGVWAEELTREALFDALHARHTLATTGEKTGLLVTSGEAMMGDKVAMPTGPIPIDVEIWSGRPVDRVTILRNNVPVFSTEPGVPHVELHWEDPTPPSSPRLWYYVRVETRAVDGGLPGLAWSSPIWFFDEVPPPRRFPKDRLPPVPLDTLSYELRPHGTGGPSVRR